MKKLLLIFVTAMLCMTALVACGKKAEAPKLSDEAKDAVDNLYSIQANYAQGVAPLIEIPPMWAEELYNNADAIVGTDMEGAPISLREYAVTNVVYFDYADDYSVVWDKNNNSVTVEPTDTVERDDFAQKAHK